MNLGTCADGRPLLYDERLYEFRLAGEVVSYGDVAELDSHAHIAWRALEQRDWFWRINPADLKACNERALARMHGDVYAGMTPEERVKADAARDDSVLAGKIVEADPALVRAVVNALEEQGLLQAQSGQPFVVNPLQTATLPKGMETLSQFERAQSGDRKMTRGEARLMNKILKNDDKEKARRERDAEREGRIRAKRRFEEQEEARREQERPAAPKGKVVSDAINVVAANPEHSRFPDVVSGEQTDAAPASHGYSPAVAQAAVALAAEEAALKEMRAKVARENEMQAIEAATVPGMKGQVKTWSRLSGLLGGFGANADGSPKRRE